MLLLSACNADLLAKLVAMTLTFALRLTFSNYILTTDNLMAQNFNNDLMRQMQQQLAAQQQRNPNQQNTNGLGSLQNGLGNINANVLMSAFQSPQGQNGQQGGLFDVQRAENILAAALAAAGNNPQNQNSGNAPQPAPAPAPSIQPNAFEGFQGLEQLQQLNPALQQAAIAVNQPNGNAFPRQQLGGLQGLQQQLANLQQQVQQQFTQGQQPNAPQQGQQVQQQGQPQNQPQNQQGIQTWMGQNMNNPGLNPAALQLTAGSWGDGNNNFQQQEIPGQHQMQAQHILFQNGNQGQFPQQVPPPPKRRSSSLSSGSLSPIGNKKAMNSNDGGLSGIFPPNLSTSSNGNEQPKARKEKKKRAKTFPEKLMQSMMEYADEQAVAWLPDGKSFVIVNPDMFCEEVLSKVFKESKYASFVRKLHRWGFVRLTSGTGTDCFHHPMFQRNRKEMCAKITCAPRGDKDKDRNSSERAVKPPSLAGVEKFIRAKVVAAAASAAAQAEESLLLKADEDLSAEESADLWNLVIFFVTFLINEQQHGRGLQFSANSEDFLSFQPF
jgi:hypothetical protein